MIDVFLIEGCFERVVVNNVPVAKIGVNKSFVNVEAYAGVIWFCLA